MLGCQQHHGPICELKCPTPSHLQYFTQRGYLLPAFHKTYWLGLTSTRWPIFSWADKSLVLDYGNWGDSQPNKSPAPGLCVYANSTLARGSPPAWGWDDTDCDASTSIFICRKASAQGTYYTSKRFGATFIFNSTEATFTVAEGVCRDHGGHLVSWSSQQEQAEAEGYFNSNGFMFPTYHKFYWMGLYAGKSMAAADLMATFSNWPNFTYLDKAPAPSSANAYRHWGRWAALWFSSHWLLWNSGPIRESYQILLRAHPQWHARCHRDAAGTSRSTSPSQTTGSRPSCALAATPPSPSATPRRGAGPTHAATAHSRSCAKWQVRCW
jgi:hypothetical protein